MATSAIDPLPGLRALPCGRCCCAYQEGLTLTVANQASSRLIGLLAPRLRPMWRRWTVLFRCDLQPRQVGDRHGRDSLGIVELHHMNSIGEDAFDRSVLAAIDGHAVAGLKRMR